MSLRSRDIHEAIEVWASEAVTSLGCAPSWAKRAKNSALLCARQMGWSTIDDFTGPSVSEWVAPMSPPTRKNRLSELRNFAKWLLSLGMIAEDPLKHAMNPKVKAEHRGPGVRAFTFEEAAAIIDIAERCEQKHGQASRFGPNRSTYYIVAWHTGARPEELDRLEWRNIDFDESLLTIRSDKQGQGPTIGLHEEAVQALRNLLGFKLGDDPRILGDGAHVLGDFMKSKVFRQVCFRTLLKDMDRANVPREDTRGRKAGFRSFRKGAVNHRLRIGQDIHDIASTTRHSVDILLRHYRDMSGAKLREIAGKTPNVNGVLKTREENISDDSDIFPLAQPPPSRYIGSATSRVRHHVQPSDKNRILRQCSEPLRDVASLLRGSLTDAGIEGCHSTGAGGRADRSRLDLGVQIPLGSLQGSVLRFVQEHASARLVQ
ncbi:MAG: tyrosine-type recombinase/integrase [Phycisphaeraceae bacterium]|nr:tyrosine-type recombinase/integrase [Phycisphaerales bacterium]MCB9858901.1 tyrosine-type recombinase/integrase [Phycisphaeraceae bacterium]